MLTREPKYDLRISQKNRSFELSRMLKMGAVALAVSATMSSCSVDNPSEDSLFAPHSYPDIFMNTATSPEGDASQNDAGMTVLPGVDIYPLQNDTGEQVRLAWYDGTSRPPFPWQAGNPKVPSTMEDHIGGGNFETVSADMGATIQKIDDIEPRNLILRYQPTVTFQGQYGADWFRYATTTISGIESVSHVHLRWSEVAPDIYEPDDHPQFARDITRYVTTPKGRTLYESHNSDYAQPITGSDWQRSSCTNNQIQYYAGDPNVDPVHFGDRDWYKLIVPDNKSILTIETFIPNEKGSSGRGVTAGHVSVSLFDGRTGGLLYSWFPPNINPVYNMGGNNQHALFTDRNSSIAYGFSRWRAPVDNDKRHQTSGGLTNLGNIEDGNSDTPETDPGVTPIENFNNRGVRLRWPLDTGFNGGLVGKGAEVFIRVAPLAYDWCMLYRPMGAYRIAITVDDRPDNYYDVP